MCVYYLRPRQINENKKQLKDLYLQAKSLGETVNHSRKAINGIKGQIEKCRLAAGVSNLVDGSAANSTMSPEEAAHRQQLDAAKGQYKQSVVGLKSLKKEIEHLQHLLEKAKVKMHRDFAAWCEGAGHGHGQQAQAYEDTASRKAWGTPPLSPIPSGLQGTAPYAGEDQGMPPSQLRRGSATSSASSGGHPQSQAGLGGAEDDIAAFFKARDAMKNR